MSALNIFIDGSWLFRACGPNFVLSSKTENPTKMFSLNFQKLNDSLLHHVKSNDSSCTQIGDAFISTSIFTIPNDLDDWPNQYRGLTSETIEKVKKGCFARNMFVQNAIASGYKDSAIFRPELKSYMCKRLQEGTFQEKQVDTTVVALLVKYAIIKPRDYHVIITGDSDILPAVKVAYPEYTNNVLIATSHPDELSAQHRQTSFSLSNFNFRIPPFYFQDHIVEIIHGAFPYHCSECHKVFVKDVPINRTARPYCNICARRRT